MVQHGRQATPLLGQRSDLGPQLVGHAVKSPRQLAHLVPAGWQQPGFQITLCHAISHRGQSAHRRRDTLSDQERQHGGQEGREQAGRHNGIAQQPHIGFDLFQGQRHPDEPQRLFILRIRHQGGSIHHVVAHGTAEARTAALTFAQGLLYFGPAQMILHSSPVKVGFAQHGAVGGDNGHPRIQQVSP